METMKERLILLCQNLHIGQNAFEKKCGWSTGTICSYNKGIRTDKLEGVIEAFPTLNIKWLIAGKGEMWESEKEAPEATKIVTGYNMPTPTPNVLHDSGMGQEWLVRQMEQKDDMINRLLNIIEKGERKEVSQSINI